MAEVIVKFSVTDLDSFYDWLQSAIEGELLISPDRAGYDAFYTLVKDGKAVTNFEPHLATERREAAAIEQALSGLDCQGTDDSDDRPAFDSQSNESLNRIYNALNNLYSE